MKKYLVLSIFIIVFISMSVTVLAYNEAPILSEMVKNNELPVVEKRLPENPLVVVPRNSIGKYGGTWRRFNTEYFNYFGWETLIKKDTNGWPKSDTPGPYVPNIAESWKINDDKTRFEFKIREGIKWSDGNDFTTEDILFWLEDILLNKELNPAAPSWIVGGEETAKITTPDEYTIIFEFKTPQMTFMDSLATYSVTNEIGRAAKHYLKQFHPKYTSKEELDKILKEEGANSWTQLLTAENKFSSAINPELPVITAWKLTSDKNEQLQTAERNPYYWKVDPDGNQLPYIDHMEWQNIENNEVKLMKTMAGEVDYDISTFTTADFPMLKESEEEGSYKVMEQRLSGLNGAAVLLYFSQDYDKVAETETDKELAELLETAKFRQAISVAINRDEVNEFVFLGRSAKRQGILSDAHPASGTELSSKYTEFNPEKANEWLDELGLDQRDSEGWRTLPSGKSFVLQINAPQNKGYRVDSAEIIAKNLQKVGINAPANILEKTLYVKRYQAAQLPVFINGNYEGMNPLNRPHFYWPVSRNTRFAPMSGSYYGSNGDDGVKPEGDMAELVNIYEKVKDELDDEKRNAMIRETMELHAENLWGVGVLGYGPAPATKSNRMKNMPDNTSNLGWNPVVVIPETFYIEE